MPVYDVTLGIDVETRKKITIGDIERRSGLYILGRPGSGKTTLIKNIIAQDIENGHGVFFLDPHRDAIDDLLQRIPSKRQKDVILLDPTEETHTFGMNLLACSDISRLDEREKTFDNAKGIFTKLFANPQTGTLDVLLDKYLRNSFYPLIANQGYTIAEIPLLLTDKQFRDHLLQHANISQSVLDFWRDEFPLMPRHEQQHQIESTLTRLGSFTRPYIQHIVGQSQTTLNFTKIMDNRKILFVKFSSSLSDDHKRIIGTILVSHLVSAVFQRDTLPEHERVHFCIFIDEFQNFAGSEDFAVLFTQGRKFAVATTIAHQERFGQFADNKAILGATDAAGNKIFFQLAVRDAQEQAAEVAKASPTETKQERHLGVAQNPFAALLQGHKHPDIHRFMQQYLRPLQYKLEDAQEDIEYERLLRQVILDEAALSRVDERYEAIQASLARGRAIPVSYDALRNTEQVLVQVREHTERLIRLYENASGQRHSLRSLNTFLTAIMEGQIEPVEGQELFSHFLLAFVRLAHPVSGLADHVLDLYISLVYGNPHLPRSIPLTLAARSQAVPHEELYRSVEAQYIRQVQARAEYIRKLDEAERDEERQKIHEANLKYIMTWKHQVASYLKYDYPHFLFIDSLDKEYKFFQAMRLQPVRAFLTPYLFAKFVPPWYYNDPQGRPPTLHIPRNPTREMQEYTLFLQQYGEGGCVVIELLKAAFRGRGEGSNSQLPNFHHYTPSVLPTYPHLHMLELPAIAGMEPFQVWQVIRQLNELLAKCSAYAITGESVWSPIAIDLNKRPAALLLLGHVETDFPDGAQLRSWWDRLTEEDIKIIGRRRDHLVWALARRYEDTWGPGWAETQVPLRLEKYKEENPRQIGQTPQTMPVQTTAGTLSLPYALERMWYRCDEMARTYLIARASDWFNYGEVVADRTFPQPTLPGISPQEVSTAVAVLLDLLLKEAEQFAADQERKWTQQVEAFVRDCLWQYDGLLRLRVYHAEGRVHMRETVEPSLPGRVLTADERKRLIDACYTELAQADHVLETLNDFVTFCQLLRQPENHVRSATHVYVDREVNTYTTAEMTNQMVQELINLLPHSAYVKSTWTGKIQTLDVSEAVGALPLAVGRSLVDIRETARHNALSTRILRTRGDIEEEIRERQDNWRSRPGNEPPPPTSTGGNSTPSLPPASAGSDPEPTTRFVPEKAPEEKPPEEKSSGKSAASRQRTGAVTQPATEKKSKRRARRPSPANRIKLNKQGKKATRQKANTPLSPALPLELESLRFFESGQGMLAIEQRQYSTSFQQQTTRCICFELSMRNMLYRQQDKRYVVKTRYVKPDGSHLMNHQEETVVHSDNEWSSYRWGIGAVKPGFWPPGTYRVVILINGIEFAEGSFVIE